MRQSDARGPGFFAIVRRLLRGDVGFFIQAVEGNLVRAQDELAADRARSLDARLAHDVAIISGVALGMMSLKVLKFLPGIPFASGHKTMLLFPLYSLAAHLTYSRWGGTTAGAIMGVLGYLQGDGRYGVLEILKHVAPGLVIDLTWPIARRLPRSVFVYGPLGLLAALARTATEFAAVMLLGARAEVYVFPAAKLVPNISAGILSGFVTWFLLPAFDRFRPAPDPAVLPTDTLLPSPVSESDQPTVADLAPDRQSGS